MRQRALLALAVVAFATSCRVPLEPVRPKQKLDPKLAYVYGRFSMNTKDSMSLLGDEKVVFQVRCRDGAITDIFFSKTTALQIIPFEPGICQLEDVVNMDEAGVPAHSFTEILDEQSPSQPVLGKREPPTRQMASFRLLQNEELQAGGVYYVGDFFAKATDNHKDGDDRQNVWSMQVRNDYERTTAEMKRTYRYFATVTTENRISR
jgi:hypothetical protein